MSGGGSGGGSNTVTQMQQIPDFEQDFSLQNQQLAQSLGSQPFPVYGGAMVAPFAPQQYAGMQMAGDSATSWQPTLDASAYLTGQAAGGNKYLDSAQQYAMLGNDTTGNIQYSNNLVGQALGPNNDMNTARALAGRAMSFDPSNSDQLGQYMSPYVAQAMAPQITALQTQIAQQHQANAAGATGAGAFGDSRQGSYDALADFYGQQSLAGLVGQGYNTAFNNAQNVMGQQQGAALQGAGQFGQMGAQQQALQLQGANQMFQTGVNQQNQAMQIANLFNQMGQGQQGVQLQGAGMLGNIAGAQQNLGIGGANALYNAGSQQQTQQQQGLNLAYQNYLNQVNWPYQQLNTRLAALSNSPYNIQTASTLPNANSAAQGFGTAASLAGLLGSLGGGSGAKAPLGGQVPA